MKVLQLLVFISYYSRWFLYSWLPQFRLLNKPSGCLNTAIPMWRFVNDTNVTCSCQILVLRNLEGRINLPWVDIHSEWEDTFDIFFNMFLLWIILIDRLLKDDVVTETFACSAVSPGTGPSVRCQGWDPTNSDKRVGCSKSTPESIGILHLWLLLRRHDVSCCP